MKRWKPKFGGRYFSICRDEVFIQQWENDGFDKTNYRGNGVFRTKKEAEAVLRRIKNESK